jgi:hypothetical protein
MWGKSEMKSVGREEAGGCREAAGLREGRGEFARMVEDTCMYCNRLMEKGEIKVLPPSYIQERDPYVRRGVVKRRLMCLKCYNTIRGIAKEKARFSEARNREPETDVSMLNSRY